MKKVTEQEFTEAYNRASKETKELMTSSKLYESVSAIFSSQGVNVNAGDTLLPIGYNLLGLMNTDETATCLEELGVKNGLRFLVDIKEKLSKEPPTNMPASKAELAAEIHETEEELESLHSIRTMAGDMKAIQTDAPTYQSSQSEILQRPTPAQPVAPPSPADSRWES